MVKIYIYTLHDIDVTTLSEPLCAEYSCQMLIQDKAAEGVRVFAL